MSRAETLALQATSFDYRSRITREYTGWVNNARHRHGDKLDLSDVMKVHPLIRNHFHGARIEVIRTWPNGETYVRRGRVSVTTGYRPALMLMHRTSDTGSSDLLGEYDRLGAIIAL